MSAFNAVELTSVEQAMLAGSEGPAVALAMRIVVGLARAQEAPRLVEVSSAHIDSCLYHGQVSLDFANRLVELQARIRVPTTLNVGSMDLLHPQYVRTDSDAERSVAEGGRALMSAYIAMGCTATWTCAPYQLPDRPRFGEHIAWAESNAIVFANSVLGARTDRYGDFLDICAAITGRAPYAGLQTDSARRGSIVFDCSDIPAGMIRSELFYPSLGYHAGLIAGTANPIFTGLPADTSEDELKALGAAAASAGGVALFHVVGRTPEAPTLRAALHGQPPAAVHRLSSADLHQARRALSTFSEGTIDAVTIGTPHASFEEISVLSRLIEGGAPLNPGITFYISTGRAIRTRAIASGDLAILESAGVKVIVDTCTYITSILDRSVRRVMTNSGKWAHYAPTNIGVDVVLGSIEECVESARWGTVRLDEESPWK